MALTPEQRKRILVALLKRKYPTHEPAVLPEPPPIERIYPAVRGAHASMPPMPQIDLERAKTIVDQAEKAFANGHISDPYEPYAEAGARTRLEAIQSILLVLAEFYEYVQERGEVAVANFGEYARGCGSIVLRISCDSGAVGEEREALGRTETADSFVRFLRSLADHEQEYWPSVYERLDLEEPRKSSCPAPTPR